MENDRRSRWSDRNGGHSEASGGWFSTRRRALAERLRSRDTRAITLGLLLAAFSLLVLLVYWIVVLTELPDEAGLRKTRFEQATIVYSADGEELTSYQDKNRKWIPLDEISDHVVEALVATEDHRFYDHSGIDLPRAVGSVFKTISGDLQGGSTITMQFARNAFPDIYDDMVVTRKVKEWLTALRLEAMYEKDDILEMYLNTVPFMYNAFGIEAAARTYFQIPASELNVGASATLVGMLKGTVYYNPVRHPERSHERRNVVLQQMVKHGYLSEEEYERRKDVPTRLSFKRLNRANEPAPHFAEYLRQWLDDWASRYGMNPYTDGLRVHTTIDSRLQEAGQQAVDAVGERLQGVADRTSFDYVWRRSPELLDAFIRRTHRYRSMAASDTTAEAALDSLRSNTAFVDSVRQAAERVQGGFVAVNPQNGHVLAWVGGRNYLEVQYDHVAVAKRQPGSAFKPFVYAAAIANGYSPNTLIADEEFEYVDPHTRRRWSPRNVGEASGRPVSLRDALAYSKNTITAQLTVDIGPRRVADYARRMGITSELDAVPSIGLGTSDVSLLEMASAYATIASYGRYRAPIFVTRIEDHQGNIVARFASESREAIPATIAYNVLDMMRGVVEYGTGVRIRSQYGVRDDVAGKTGTSQNGADGWFMLIHPNLSMGAWVGFESPAFYFRSDYYAQGAHTALPVVGRFFSAAKRSAPDLLSSDARFNPPPGYVAPSPVDTSGFDELSRYASYYDSLREASDSLFRAFSDTARQEDLWEDFDFDEMDDDIASDGDSDEEDDGFPEDAEGSEGEESRPIEEDIEDVETADSLNRRERRNSDLPSPGN